MTQQTHFFASCVVGYGTGETREAAFKDMVRNCGSTYLGQGIKNAKKEKRPGITALVVEVELPFNAEYWVSDHLPQVLMTNGKLTDIRVKIGEVESVWLTSSRGTTEPRPV